MAIGFLAGVRVVDLSQWLPGPLAAQLLGDLGAEVLKIEPPQGDPMRSLDPPDADGTAFSYKLVNAGKRVLRVDLKNPALRTAVEPLLAKADVLVESFRPGTLERLGLGRAVLAALNPGLVHVALSGWGQDGPYRLRSGHDLNYMAVGGGLASSGTAETPVMTYPPVADHAAAQQAVIAVLGALFARSRSGRGAYLDVSLMESVLAWQSMPLTQAARGVPPARGRALLSGGAAYYQIYHTADGRAVTLAAIEPKFWQAFCSAVDRPQWLERQDEPLPQSALTAELAQLFAERTLADWRQLLGEVDCCFEPVVEPGELAHHPQVQARAQLVTHPGTAPLVETLLGLRVDGAAPPQRTPVAELSLEQAVTFWS